MSKSPSIISLAIASKKEDLATALVTVTALRKELADMRDAQRLQRASLKFQRSFAKSKRAEAVDAKKAARIAKLEAKLAAMKSPVGTLAIKAAKKPSKVKVTRMAA